MVKEESYEHFYEELGRCYPESRIVYSEPLGQARRKLVRSCLVRLAAKGYSLLDVGCNDGHYSLHYAAAGARAHGIDVSESLVKIARNEARRLGLSKATFEVADIETFAGGRYDAVLLSEVLEHVRHPDRVLSSVARCLRGGGILLLTTPAPAWEAQSIRELLRDRLSSHAIVKSKVFHTEKSAVARYLHGDYEYRHDEYYPLGLRSWVEGFGFGAAHSGTFFCPRGILRLTNANPRLQLKLPLLNLLGVNNFHVFRRLQHP